MKFPALLPATLAMLVVALVATPALAQDASGLPQAPAAPMAQGQPQAVPAAPAAQQWTINVQLEHGADSDADLTGTPVILEAARPRGPFEVTAPEPVARWTSVANAEGLAVFNQVPAAVAQQGLRLNAHATYGGVPFSSRAYAAANGVRMNVRVFDRGHDLSGLRVASKRVIVEPWEEYIILSQTWTFTLDAEHAVDVAMLPDPAYERGLPIRLPVKAEGIRADGQGTFEVINNVVFWKGVIKPGEPVTMQIRFSVSARDDVFNYEQEMAWPTDTLQLIAPLQTQYKRTPRLGTLELVAPGFELTTDASSLGLRDDMEFLIANRSDVAAGQTYAFQLRGLPFGRPMGGWIALALGVLVSLLVIVFGLREHRRLHDGSKREEIVSALNAERELLLDELAELRRLRQSADEETRWEIDAEVGLLRERLSLILSKLRDLGHAPQS